MWTTTTTLMYWCDTVRLTGLIWAILFHFHTCNLLQAADHIGRDALSGMAGRAARFSSLLGLHQPATNGDSVNICILRLYYVSSCNLWPRFVFSASCNVYISSLCYDVSVRLSVRLSVTEVHWCIIANLGFKSRSHFTVHCGRRAACGRIISRYDSQC